MRRCFWTGTSGGRLQIDYIDRCYDLHGYTGPGRSLVLYGIRRAGKSYLAYGYLQRLISKGEIGVEDTLILNLEDPRLSTLTPARLIEVYNEYERLLSPSQPHVVIDEAQAIPGWEQFVRYLIDSRHARVIVTGSSSKLMSREYATLLTGRHVDLEVYTLNLTEALLFKGYKLYSRLDVYKHRAAVENTLKELLEHGGFPEAILSQDHVKPRLIQSYLRDILMKDIAARHRIRDTRLLETLAYTLLATPSTVISSRRLAKTLNAPQMTLERYISHLEEARLITLLKKVDTSARRIERSQRKIYIADNGIHTHATHSIDEPRGKLLENTVFLHLARNHPPNHQLYYYRDPYHGEVDFVLVRKGRIKAAIQATLELRYEDNEQYRREIRPLLHLHEKARPEELIIVTLAQEDEIKHGKATIKVVPAWKYLTLHHHAKCRLPPQPDYKEQ